MTARPLVALVAKDLRVFLADRYAVVLTAIAPIALASFMASIFGGAGETTTSPIPVRIVDEDRSPTSASLVASAKADPMLVAEPSGRDEAIAAVRSGGVAAALILPKGFGEAAAQALDGGGSGAPELTFVVDPTRRADFALARGIFTRLIFEAIAAGSLPGDLEVPSPAEPQIEAIPAVAGPAAEVVPDSPEREEFLGLFRGIDRRPRGDDRALESDRAEFRRTFPGVAAWADDSASRPPEPAGPEPIRTPAPDRKPAGFTAPYRAREISITAEGKGGDRGALSGHAFAGMAVQFVLFSATEWGIGLMSERRNGLWKRLRSAPVSRYTLMASKAIGCAIISLGVIVVVLSFGRVAFGFGVRGSGVGLALVALAYSAMAASFGLMVASLGRSPEGARAVAIMAVLVMTMLGGGWIPTFLFPAWLQRLTPAIPTRWAIDGFDGAISRGFTLAETMPSVFALIAFGAGFGLVAVLSHRWDEV